MKPQIALTTGLAACAAIVGSAYVLEVLSRVARDGGTHVGGDVIVLAYLDLAVGALLAVPALRSGTLWVRRTGVAVGGAAERHVVGCTKEGRCRHDHDSLPAFRERLHRA